ncbi:cobalamin biosynthesis protein CbiX [Putridiphycobacter roseus]|uniref:Cobalamin biosynthesis protein CbiX n=1 Tax=Putridiphycobacter roseus TaxID=2219161 RepID=A0A2W1NI30_9FLAO|nr:CbiX/SirB N-terminal domain-containing protein [Putridiphycobacter roseus]PZE18683.1 cobalamin biosynthesis protein CbiX [Putridiphycobacter roseus]
MKKLIILCLGITLFSCNSTKEEKTKENTQKIGIILVNHGSVSETWRNMLLDMEDQVEAAILKNPLIGDVKTAFMEYNEPSIATRLKEYDAEGYTDVIIVPVFLTVSSHYSHDIPVIAGISSDPKIQEELAKEKIEVYNPKANVTITPPLNYTTLLKKNIERRVMALSESAENEAILLVAYGDEQYNQQWEEMVEEIGKYLKFKTGHESIAYAWCGHIVRYSSEPTTEGIEQLLKLEDNVIVIPVLVANDEFFQGEIIQNGVDASSNTSAVKYKQDALLPDENLNAWVIDITNQTVENINK